MVLTPRPPFPRPIRPGLGEGENGDGNDGRHAPFHDFPPEAITWLMRRSC